MTPQEIRQVLDRMDAGRRAATTLLQQCDVGIPAEVAIRELAPGLSPQAVDSARRLVGLCAFDFACLAMALSGLASDESLGRAEFPEPPPRPVRPTPDELAAELLGFELPPGCPGGTGAYA